MSKCNCGQANVPLGVTSVTAGGITHGVTACVSGWGERAEVVALSEEVTLLRAQVQRVRELHYGYDAMDGRRRCGCCGHPWPCLTALAVDGDGDE